MNKPIAAVAVVVPAYNEDATIGACLESLLAAASVVALPSFIVVVDDASDDSTARVARAVMSGANAVVLRGQGANVGAARALGMDAALAHFANVPREQLWLATTDADSTVPQDWLEHQLQCADAGVDALAGIIEISPVSRLHRKFASLYQHGVAASTHTHIHGANMAMRASIYLEAGGFTNAACGEDVSLWQRVRSLHGVSAHADPGLVVQTSARLDNRVDGGFGGYLQGIASAAS